VSPGEQGKGRFRPLPPEEGPPPQMLGAAIDEYLAATGMGGTRAVAALVLRWSEVAGEAAAAHSEPVGLRDGTLLVRVDHPGWVAELAFLEQRLVEQAFLVLGEPLVRAVKVRVRG
jgi:predicted nucleic acid-binding Zn ribbon protein